MSPRPVGSPDPPVRPDPWGPAVGAAIVAVCLAAATARWGPDVFGRYFGAIPPAWATAAAVAGGLGGMGVLRRSGWLWIGRGDAGGARTGIRRAIVLAPLFVLPVVLVDLRAGFGPDINVEAPWSLAFYPLVAVVAESVFHLVPLGLAAAIATPVSRWVAGGADRRTPPVGRGAALVAVALIEPVLQIIWGAGSPDWARRYVGVHVLAFNLVGLHLLRRYGFLAVLAFRAVYYLVWHVAWGAVRLPLLF